MRTGIFATLLAALVANFFFLEPVYALSFTSIDLIQIGFFTLEAYTRTEDRIKALSSGFQFHVPKPVEPAEFITVIANLVNRL